MVAPCRELIRRRANLLLCPPTAVPDRDAVGVGDRDAHVGVRAGCGESGKVAAKVRVEDTQSVPFTWAVCEPKQGGQRESQIRQDRALWFAPEGEWR